MFNTTRLGKRNWLIAWILVGFQFLLIGLIVLTSPLLNLKSWVIVSAVIGIALGLYAIQTIRLGNFNISPYVKANGKLIAHGPYRLVRHPMYTAILVTCWPLVLGHFSYQRLAFVIGLTLVLIIKLHIEEHYLKRAFPTYLEYTRISKKLIPFIY